DTGADHAIIVSVDACAVDLSVLDRVRDVLAERLPDMDPRKLIASATHTHTAPFAGCGVVLQKDADYMDDILAKYPDYMTTAEYTDLLVEALVSAACEAWNTRSAGALGWGYSYAVVGENRRVRYFDDRAVMYGSTALPDFSHIEGHVDHGVNLLFCYDADTKLTGVLVNLACPSQCSEGGQDYVSADYWHEVREELRKRYGSDLFVLPQCSAAGDLSPHRQIAAPAEDRMLRLKYGEGLARGSNTALRRDLAKRIGYAVDDAEPCARQDLQSHAEMIHTWLDLDLPHWDVTETEYEDARKEIAELEKTIAKLEGDDPLGRALTSAQSRRGWCGRVVERYESPPASVPAQVNVMRLGAIAFVTVPFEYYLDFGD
ncbi:MAG: hypothetical protein KAI66_27415, partial [Lentisphaeria bacterium]|nr:hypothetical protein [Lentisphaeria bacterium]